MMIMIDTGFENGIKIRRDLAPVEITIPCENGYSQVSPMVEQYIIENVGGTQEAFTSAVRNATEALNHAMWLRVGMSVNKAHPKAVVTGTNSSLYDMPDLSGEVTISFTAEGSVV